MAQFLYNFMMRGRGTNVYVAPNHYQDVKDIHQVNCAFCDNDATVQDVINWEKTLEYMYTCQLGHSFNIMYHKLKEYKKDTDSRKKVKQVVAKRPRRNNK